MYRKYRNSLFLFNIRYSYCGKKYRGVPVHQCIIAGPAMTLLDSTQRQLLVLRIGEENRNISQITVTQLNVTNSSKWACQLSSFKTINRLIKNDHSTYPGISSFLVTVSFSLAFSSYSLFASSFLRLSTSSGSTSSPLAIIISSSWRSFLSRARSARSITRRPANKQIYVKQSCVRTNLQSLQHYTHTSILLWQRTNAQKVNYNSLPSTTHAFHQTTSSLISDRGTETGTGTGMAISTKI